MCVFYQTNNKVGGIEMKKSKVLITAIVGGAILLAGCTNNLSPASVSKNLTHNLNVLSSTVKNLDTINNSYLSNPDIILFLITQLKPLIWRYLILFLLEPKPEK